MDKNKVGSKYMEPPYRNWIFQHVKDPAYIPKVLRWFYKDHVEDSISMTGPFCGHYSTYHALPVPPDGEDFGTYNLFMTNHLFYVDRSEYYGPESTWIRPYCERWPKDFLEMTCQPPTNEFRDPKWHGSRNGYHPFVSCYTPLMWEYDLKGSERTIDDGPNYRWVIIFKYPEGVSVEEGDEWFLNTFAPEVCEAEEVTRFLTAPCIPHFEKGPWNRVAEIWFEDAHKWHDAMVKNADRFTKPAWSQWDQFPYLEPYKDFTGIFVLDYPNSNHLRQWDGYYVTR